MEIEKYMLLIVLSIIISPFATYFMIRVISSAMFRSYAQFLKTINQNKGEKNGKKEEK